MVASASISFGQKQKSSLGLSIGNEAALPVGELKTNYTSAFGMSAQIEYKTAKRLAYTVTGGYLTYVRKKSVTETFGEFPVTAGAKYYLASNLYIQAGAGVSFFDRDNTQKFRYDAGVGFKVKNFNIDTKFQSDVLKSDDLSTIGLRVAYRF